MKDAVLPVPEAAPVQEWENRLQREITRSPQLAETEKQALVTSRIGQGLFKENVWAVETSCRVTGVANPNHLIGSHIKPWRDNKEHLGDSLARMGVEDEQSAIQKPFTHLQRRYLDFHRDKIFLSRNR